jgi:hypothetical protein
MSERFRLLAKRNQAVEDAREVAADAAAVAQSAAVLAGEAAAETAAHPGDNGSAALHDAAQVVQDAAAVVQSAAAMVADAASWPEVERRRKLRLPAFKRHEARVEWKHIALYVPILLLVIAVGGLAIWSFIEKQSLVIQPARLPPVTLVTANADSPLTASWVKLLNAAEMQTTLVPLEKVEVLQGVVVLCDVPRIPDSLVGPLSQFIGRGGAVVVLGAPPENAIGPLQLSATTGTSDDAFKLSEGVSPVLARLNPGYEVSVWRRQVAFLKETPRMNVDARWRTNARAVVMHIEQQGSRYLWMGFDPAALPPEPDRQLMLMLRTSFRWVDGQPVSEGAVGAPAEAKTLTPAARREARAARFSFSVDPLGKKGMFSVRMTNRGDRPIANPTVKVWLPPGVTEVSLAGDLIMKRSATLIGVPEEGACLVSLPSLTRNEDRVMKLRIVSRR